MPSRIPILAPVQVVRAIFDRIAHRHNLNLLVLDQARHQFPGPFRAAPDVGQRHLIAGSDKSRPPQNMPGDDGKGRAGGGGRKEFTTVHFSFFSVCIEASNYYGAVQSVPWARSFFRFAKDRATDSSGG